MGDGWLSGCGFVGGLAISNCLAFFANFSRTHTVAAPLAFIYEKISWHICRLPFSQWQNLLAHNLVTGRKTEKTITTQHNWARLSWPKQWQEWAGQSAGFWPWEKWNLSPDQADWLSTPISRRRWKCILSAATDQNVNGFEGINWICMCLPVISLAFYTTRIWHLESWIWNLDV